MVDFPGISLQVTTLGHRHIEENYLEATRKGFLKNVINMLP
jgi:hypothetical protein